MDINIELCLVCFEDKTLLSIDESFRNLLRIMLDDGSDILPAICQDCKRMVERMHLFGKRNKRSSDILQAFIDGKLCSEDTEPESSTSTKDRDLQQEDQAAKRRRTSVDSHVEVAKPKANHGKAVNQRVDSASDRKKEERRKISPKRKYAVKDYRKSDEFLFGCSDLELGEEKTQKIAPKSKFTSKNHSESSKFLFE